MFLSVRPVVMFEYYPVFILTYMNREVKSDQ